MTVANEIKDLQKEVERLLILHPRLRDSDRSLSANIWVKQLNRAQLTMEQFLHLYCAPDSKLASQESIGRCRRKLQELYPELRGTKYSERQGEQKNVINTVNNLNK